ncbi:Thermophilic serine proteinase [Thermus thermophilus]|uniref:Thermophilic serine proteinase n=1 Tax=Thermus thermophilus TaxID=274 RepID=A0A3P4ASD6_THETH|nr:S8 family serine peptidase [Thermus thermophilus]VCU53274.1 Thermophilic serine proteinase [Thermus thermophilus]
MKRLLFGALFLSTALLLTACPQNSPPPVNSAECPVGPQAAPQAWEPLRLQGLGRFKGAYVPGEVLALPAPGLSLQSLGLRAEGVEPLEELPFGLVRFKVPEGQEEAKAQALLRAGMRYVQPNYIYRPLALPNDPYYLTNQRPYLNGLVGLEAAWERSTGRGCPPVVAVLDTGVDKNHPDLKGSLWLPDDTLDVADDDRDPTDRDGHGTAVAGVVAAQTNNGLGIAGVTWGGYLLPIKVFSDSGQGSSAELIKGVDQASALGARVINLSLCLVSLENGEEVCASSEEGYDDSGLTQAIRQAHSKGIVFVGASGNYNQSVVGYPASLPEVIAVGAVKVDGSRAGFSNTGQTLDLVAPGDPVFTTSLGGGYGWLRGTSFSSPIVAGVVALYMSKYASERKAWPSPDQVYQCLTNTAEDLGPAGWDPGYGFGLVRADRAMTDTTYCFP